MEYIEPQTLLPGWVGLLGWIGTAVFFLASLYFLIRYNRKHAERDNLISYSLMIPFAVCFLSALMSTAPNRAAQGEDFREAVGEKYGIELADDELIRLEYPGEQPTKDFEAFGSFSETIRKDGKIVSQSIHLIWEDGGFFLAESTGEQLTELETTR